VEPALASLEALGPALETVLETVRFYKTRGLYCAGNYEAVEPALASLEALGPALESHLQLLLPALVRLICPGATLSTTL
jgi:hypothetical protein